MTFDSLLEEARSRNPAATDEDLIIAISADLVELLDLEPPVNPEVVASYQGISGIERWPLEWAGCLVPEEGRLVIRVRDSDPPTRQRFTTFHEIAHTFFPGYRHAPQYRCAPLRVPRQENGIEALCDVAASELLLPARYIRPRLAKATFDLDTVEALASECEASMEAAARRLVTLWSGPCLLIGMERETEPSQPDQAPKLRVSYTHVNGRWPCLPTHGSIRDDHVLNECTRGQSVDCITDLDDLAMEPMGDVEVHARPYPFTDSDNVHHDRILVLARPTSRGVSAP